jgi:DNA-binding transcriptional LysR family regulator
LTLSHSGKVLLGYAEQLLRLSAEAEAALQGDAPRGTLRLGTLESTAATRLPPILARLHAGCPQVRIELVTGTTGALVAKVLAEEIEAAFVAEPFTPHDFEAQHAFTEELVLIAPRALHKATAPRVLAEQTMIAFAAGCSYRRRLEDWLRGAKLVPDRVMEFGSYHAIVACVAAGAGVAVVPRSVVRATGAGKSVAAHRLPAALARARTMLIWRRGHRSAALDALQREVARVALATGRRARA